MLHVLLSDEAWFFHAGDPIEMIQINSKGALEHIVLGKDILKGQKLQHIVSKNVWQGSRLKSSGKWALVSCMVAPGFEYDDTQVSSRKELLNMFPEHAELIKNYTYKDN